MSTASILKSAAENANSRFELWSLIVQSAGCKTCAEVGVYEGHYAEHVLGACPGIKEYYMVDPWRHLDEWNKPLNRPNDQFVKVKAKALSKTEFAADRRHILQGLTTEVAHKIADESLDFAYIDGDHTLRGITIDLYRMWSKVKDGGLLCGDDFCNTVWQHSRRYEPTLIFPYAIYFAEALGVPIFGLPYDQFAIQVDRSPKKSFAFHDLAGKYQQTTVRAAIANRPSIMKRAKGLVAQAVFSD